MEANKANKIMINQDYFTDGKKDGLAYCSLDKMNPSRFRALSAIDEIIIHCTATPPKAYKNWDDPRTCINYDLNPNHISRSGLATATYHFYINRKAEVFQLVSMGIITAHCKGHNSNAVAVCINHDGFTDDVTEEMKTAIAETCAYIFDKLDFAYNEENVNDVIAFHRQYAPKACPGVIDREDIVKRTAAILKTQGDNY